MESHPTNPEILDRRLLLGAAGLAGLAALTAGRAVAGPLTPPAGTIAGTGRTLDEIYNRIPNSDGRIPIPGGSTGFAINAPGSYVLTGNLTTGLGNPITINATGVDLDLNGFTVSGTADATAIVIISGRSIRIHDGCVREGYYGINTGLATMVVLEDLRIDRCRYSGIQGSSSSRGNVYRRCIITDTGALTTTADAGMTIRGINLAGSSNLAIECTVHKVSSLGPIPQLRGIDVSGSNNIVSRCTVSSDTSVNGNGLTFASGAGLYRDNTVLAFAMPYLGGVNGNGNA